MARKTKKTKRKRDHLQKKPSRTDAFQQALAYHQAGRLQEAESLYRRILAKQPDHSQALHYLGILAHQTGRDQTAAELISMALARKPEYVDAHINLGITLKTLGEIDDAAASLQRALALDPRNAVACYNLGNIFREQGRLEQAAASYKKAVTLRPDYAEARYNLGNVLNDQGRKEDAIACFKQALVLKPDYAQAYNNLGNILKEKDRLEEAAACYRQAITIKPDDAVAHNNLGNTLKDLGKPKEAISSFLRAIELNPDFAEAHHGLGIAYKEIGRLADAAASYRKALSLNPGYARAYLNLSMLARYTAVDNHVRNMESLYRDKATGKTDLIDLGFALGKVFEDIKDYARSFDYLLEANRLKRSTYEYSIREDQDLFAAIKKTFSPVFFSSHNSMGLKDKTPIFILGMPRSGTSLVEQILASHPLVFGGGELAILADLTEDFCAGQGGVNYPECIPELQPDTFEKLGAEYLKKVREYSREAEYITDKMPHNFLHVGLIKTILPQAKVIHCRRDPLDTCFSIFKTEFAGEHKYAYDLIELGQYYNLYQDLMAYWEKVLPGFIYPLVYEELVADQQKQTKELLQYCGLPWDDACLAFHKTKRRVSTASVVQVRKPIYNDSVGLWKRHENTLEPLRKAIYG